MSKSPSKVNSGPPIWLWLILVPLTLAIIGGVYFTSIPPDLDRAYEIAVAALEDPNGKPAFDKNLALIEADPRFADNVRYLKGRLALNQNRDPMALRLFGEIPKDSPLKPEADRRTGDSYRRMGQVDNAIAAYQRSVEADPNGGLEARLSLASLYFSAGAIDLAMAELNKNIELDSAHEDSHILRARLRVFRDEHELAREDFEMVLDSPGKYSSAAPQFVAEYFKCLVSLKDLEKLREVAQAHLGTIGDATVRSSVLSEIGEFREAMLALQTMEGEDTQSADFKRAQLKLLLSEGSNAEAANLAKEMVARIPRDEEVMKLASQAFAANGDTRMQKIADENYQQLRDLKAQLRSAIADVSGNITDAQGRAKVARLFRQLGDYSQMDSWFGMAAGLDKSLQEEYAEARSGKNFPRDPLVPFDDSQSDDTAAANETGNEEESAAKTKNDGDEAVEKSSSDNAGAENTEEKTDAKTSQEQG